MRKVVSHSLAVTLFPTPKQLACIIDIVSAARGLFCWLNRYLFTCLNDYSACRDVIGLCIELAESLHKDWSDVQVENRVVSICQNICGICENILDCSPESLLNQTATLETVQIKPDLPQYNLGIEIKSTSSGQHFVWKKTDETPAGRCEKILPGDEVIEVNGQVVVGWTRKNLVEKLRENSDGVILVLKKVSIASSPLCPVLPSYNNPYSNTALTARSEQALPDKNHSAPATPTHCTPLLANPCNTSPLMSNKMSYHDKTSSKNTQKPGSTYTKENSHTTSSGMYPWSPTFWESASSIFPLSPTSPQSSNKCTTPKEKQTLSNSETEILQQNSQNTSRPRSGSDSFTTPSASPAYSYLLAGILRPTLSDSNLKVSTNIAASTATSVSAEEVGEKTPETVREENLISKSQNNIKSPQVAVTKINNKQTQHGKEKSPGTHRKRKGVATKLSRRRVSCRDLGDPDCDGWLWKKKENAGFMSQRWKNCWCVLKGDRLYWYNAQQDEKALGLVNVSSYTLESIQEPKKKYAFQLCHRTYKPFVFAANNLADMSKWVARLVAALSKHKTSPSSSHTREEDCYSETEAEEQDEDHLKTQELVKNELVQSQNKKSPEMSPPTAETGASAEVLVDVQQGNDTLESLLSCLQQGGVSLIGTKTAFTRDEYRSSFIRRNKNPEINRKAHTLRALQSTLKAKLLELEALNQILETPNLTSIIYQKWKSDHVQLYETLGTGPKTRDEGGDTWRNPESSGEEKAEEEVEEMV
ncbi:hypothetical protein GDO86_003496 [Hymenochirus boettgeri]|nr:hypothetical protein GDO86_003496 [Hymenochirus boettgeri]